MNQDMQHETAAVDHGKMLALVDPDRFTRQHVNEVSKENLELYFNLTGKPDFTEPTRTPAMCPLLIALPNRKPKGS